MTNSFRARSTLTAGDRSYEIWSLAALPQDKLARLPYSLKILLENLLRFEDGVSVTRADIEALLEWDPHTTPAHEIAFTPARVILQDFTGVPQFFGRATQHRHRSPGEPRIPGARDFRHRSGRHPPRLPGHTRRHRFPHHHDQRPGGAGLGRGWDRG